MESQRELNPNLFSTQSDERGEKAGSSTSHQLRESIDGPGLTVGSLVDSEIANRTSSEEQSYRSSNANQREVRSPKSISPQGHLGVEQGQLNSYMAAPTRPGIEGRELDRSSHPAPQFQTPSSEKAKMRNELASGKAARESIPYLPNELRLLERQLAALKVELSQNERKNESLENKVEDFVRSIQSRLERFSSFGARLEEAMTLQNRELLSKMANITAKVNERKVNESRIQDLVDRHNTLVRNFENRLHALQRVVSEQEMSLHNYHAALEEARAEITRLKRL